MKWCQPGALVFLRLVLATGGVVGKQATQSRLEFDFRHDPHLLSLACRPFRLNLNHAFLMKQ